MQGSLMSRWILSATVAIAALAAMTAGAHAEMYDLDSDHTDVHVSWDHLGMSRQSASFTSAKGTLDFNPEKPEASNVDVTIAVKSIATGVKALDELLLHSKEYFDPETHPAITFKSTGVAMTGGKSGQVAGDLTINGISKQVVLDVVWNFSGEHPLAAINPTYAGTYASGFSATTQIRRSDWGLTRTIPYISDELKITIETEMLRRALLEPPIAEVEITPTAPPENAPESVEDLLKKGDASSPPAGGLGNEKVDDGR
jgi:polyisoprenoid-binding protein YceI